MPSKINVSLYWPFRRPNPDARYAEQPESAQAGHAEIPQIVPRRVPLPFFGSRSLLFKSAMLDAYYRLSETPPNIKGPILGINLSGASIMATIGTTLPEIVALGLVISRTAKCYENTYYIPSKR